MKNKDFVFYAIIIVLIVLFIASAIIFKIYNIDILPSQFYGALIGVFITAIVTAFLLHGQTKGNEKREKSVKIFEKKLEVYQKFFDVLEDIAQEKQINEARLNKLIFQIGHVRMHTTNKNIKTLIEKLKEFVECVNFENIEEGNNAKLTKKVITIAEILRKELYSDAQSENEEKINLEFMDKINQATLIGKLNNKMPKSEKYKIWSDNINDIRLVYEFGKNKLVTDTYFEGTKCLQEVFYRNEKNDDIAKLQNFLNEDNEIRGEITESQKKDRFLIKLVSTELEDIAKEIQDNHGIIKRYINK